MSLKTNNFATAFSQNPTLFSLVITPPISHTVTNISTKLSSILHFFEWNLYITTLVTYTLFLCSKFKKKKKMTSKALQEKKATNHRNFIESFRSKDCVRQFMKAITVQKISCDNSTSKFQFPKHGILCWVDSYESTISGASVMFVRIHFVNWKLNLKTSYGYF